MGVNSMSRRKKGGLHSFPVSCCPVGEASHFVWDSYMLKEGYNLAITAKHQDIPRRNSDGEV